MTKKLSKHKALILTFVIVVVLITGAVASGSCFGEQKNSEVQKQLEETVDKQLDGIDFDSLEQLLNQNDNESSLFSGDLKDKLKQILNGTFDTDAASFLQFVFDILFTNLKQLFPMLAGIAVVCVLSGLIDKTKANLLSAGTGGLINFFCFATVLLLLLTAVWQLLNTAKDTVYTIKSLSNIVMPVLITFMAATGATTSAKVYSPAVALLSEGVTEVVANVVLPMFIFAVVFCVISNLSQEIKLSKLSSFFKNATSWVLGITFTIFTGFLAVQGLTAATIDGVSIRAAKFATKTYIPILGGYLADGFDLILASCILIKNSFGVVALLVLLSIVLSPILSIIVFNLGLQLISAFVEPIADKKIVSFLTDIGKSLTILLVSVLAATFMLFILIMLTIFTANVL